MTAFLTHMFLAYRCVMVRSSCLLPQFHRMAQRISSQKKHICVWRNASPLGGFLGDRGYLWNVLLESEIVSRLS